jgi:flavin-dependent dehydrogenase
VEEAGVTIVATITAGEAAARVWDVVVVGAGPAGAVAARQAARRGLRVLLADRAAFPRGKVCGCCLNGNALAALTASGLGDLPCRLGAVLLRRVTVSAGGRSATLPLPRGVSLSREAFDAELVRAAVAAGAAFLPEAAATLGEVRDGVRVVRLGTVPVTARVVAAADGLNGRLTGGEVTIRPGSRIGAGAVVADAPDFFEPGTIYMATGRGGYVGLVRVEGGRLDVAAALDAEFVRATGGPGPAAAAIHRETGWPAVPGLAEAKWKGTPPLTRTPRRIAGERWFAVGDAAGYVEPFTGEGMAWAVGSAVAVAPLLDAAARCWDDRLAAVWRGRLAGLVGHRQRVCRVVAAGLRSPVVTRAMVRLLSAVPAVARPVVRALNRPPSLLWQESPA